jgi:hypothetical protein
MHQLPSQGWKTNKTSTRFEPEHKQPMLHTKSSKDDESSGDGVAVGSSKLTRSKKNMRRRQLVPTYNASTPLTSRKTNKTSTRFQPEHKQPMLHTKSSKDDESSGDGVVVGSSKLIRSKKNMRRRQLVPTYNASTPFTRLENKQD